MYVTNRKTAFKVVKKYKNGNFLLRSKYGNQFKEAPSRLASAGYHEVKTKPEVFK